MVATEAAPDRTELAAAEEARLLRSARDGDADAFAALVRGHAVRVHALLIRMLGNPADADEVAQEVFLAAWRGLVGFRGASRFSTWLYRIAVNEANRRLGREARRRTLPLDEVMDDVPDLSEPPVSLAAAAELERHVERCVAELPPHYRVAVVLRDVEGLTNEEACSVLGLHLRNFKSRLHRGRMAVRHCLEVVFGRELRAA